MSLPNLLVIGAMRSGTTWLDGLLRSHPSIFLPEKRKEIHFFDAYYDRGIDWYKSFFPPSHGSYHWLGETTPRYLFHPQVPDRIRHILPECKFMAILRNPVDRAYSHYGLSVRDGNEKRSFSEFLEHYPGVFERGLYGTQVKRYLKYFDQKNFLFLIFEKALSDKMQTCRKIAEFLQIDPDGFVTGKAEGDKVNPSYRPVFGKLYALCRRAVRDLRQRDYDRIINLGKRSGMKRLFGNKGELPKLQRCVYRNLMEQYESDIALLESMIGENLKIWRLNCDFEKRKGF